MRSGDAIQQALSAIALSPHHPATAMNTEPRSLKLFSFFWLQLRLLISPERELAPGGQPVPAALKRGTRILALWYLTTGLLFPSVCAGVAGRRLWEQLAEPGEPLVVPMALCFVGSALCFLLLSVLGMVVAGGIASRILPRHDQGSEPVGPAHSPKTTD